ncbi:MAG: hypothetical protein Q9228_001704 [Teloschistes exilis]
MESSSPFNSPVYKILAGPAVQPFYVHADFLSKSEVLKREIHGRWKESEEKQITWRHWHVSAVGKFIEWLYTGDFKCLYPTKVETGGSSYRQNHDSPRASAEDVSKTEPRPGNRYFNHYLSANLRLNISSGSTSPQPLPTLYELEWPGSRKFSKLPQAEEYDEWTDDQMWHSEELNYEEVFMTYAELYVMASTYMMDELKNVAWQRLRSVLKRIGVPVPGSLLIEHLANLIHYTFKETGNIGDEEDHLRMLVTTFAALHFTTIKGPEIDSLLVSSSFSDREFVLALTDKIAHQMKYLQSRASIFTSDPELYFLCKSMQ